MINCAGEKKKKPPRASRRWTHLTPAAEVRKPQQETDFTRLSCHFLHPWWCRRVSLGAAVKHRNNTDWNIFWFTAGQHQKQEEPAHPSASDKSPLASWVLSITRRRGLLILPISYQIFFSLNRIKLSYLFAHLLTRVNATGGGRCACIALPGTAPSRLPNLSGCWKNKSEIEVDANKARRLNSESWNLW